MIKAIIFDLDGVIIDSEPLHFEADRLTMRDYGMELPDGELIAFVGVSGPEMWEHLIFKYQIPDSRDNIIARQKAHKKVLLADASLVAIPGIRELLLEAKAAGLKIGLASSSPRYFIEAILRNLGIDAYFEAVVSGEEVARSKPSPDVFLKAAEELGICPEDCLVIEDSGHGVRAAKTAGMACAGFINPNSGVQDLALADVIVDSFCKISLRTFL